MVIRHAQGLACRQWRSFNVAFIESHSMRFSAAAEPITARTSPGGAIIKFVAQRRWTTSVP